MEEQDGGLSFSKPSVRRGYNRPAQFPFRVVAGRALCSEALARYWLFQVSAQILEDVLFALLDLKQNRLGHPSIVLP